MKNADAAEISRIAKVALSQFADARAEGDADDLYDFLKTNYRADMTDDDFVALCKACKA